MLNYVTFMRRTIIAGAVGLLACAVLPAQTVTYTATTPTTETDFYGNTVNGLPLSLEYLAFPFFVPASNQTLTGVSISLSAFTGANNDPTDLVDHYTLGEPSQFNPSNTNSVASGIPDTISSYASLQVYILENNSACLGSIGSTAGAEASASCLIGNVGLGSLSINPSTGAGAGFSNTKTLAAGANATVPLTINLSGTFSDSNLAYYKSAVAGTLLIPVYVEAPSAINVAGGNGSDALSEFVGTSGSITYTYTTSSSTPEPGSAALIGLGLSSLALVRRRRRS